MSEEEKEFWEEVAETQPTFEEWVEIVEEAIKNDSNIINE